MIRRAVEYSGVDVDRDALGRFFVSMSVVLDERQRRLQAGAMATLLGRGGQVAVSVASGIRVTR